MKLCAGLYKIPEMFPSEFCFPNGFKISNHIDERIFVNLTGSREFYQGIDKDESVCLWLEEGMFLKVTGAVEIVMFNPENE